MLTDSGQTLKLLTRYLQLRARVFKQNAEFLFENASLGEVDTVLVYVQDEQSQPVACTEDNVNFPEFCDHIDAEASIKNQSVQTRNSTVPIDGRTHEIDIA